MAKVLICLVACLAFSSIVERGNGAVSAGLFSIVPPGTGSASVAVPAAPSTASVGSTSTVSTAGVGPGNTASSVFPNNGVNNGGIGYNGNGNTANNAFYNGALGGTQTTSGPWGNGAIVTADADTVINDFNRFTLPEITGTWAISAEGFAHRPHHDDQGKLWAHPMFPLDTVAEDLPITFVGLLCIDRNGGCTLSIVVNIGGREAIVRQSDASCQATVRGNGQGFVRTNLVVTAGCDRHMAFPNALVLPFVLGENGLAFFEVAGCLFGLREFPFFASTPNIAGGFQCMPAHSNSDEADVSGLAPLTMSGIASRQNGQIRVQGKNQWSMNGGMGPWGGTGTSTGTTGNAGWGQQQQGCTCNNYVSSGTNAATSNPCDCLDQQHCLPFDTFLLPFSLHSGLTTVTSTGTLGIFQEFQAGCIDVMFIVGGFCDNSDYNPSS